jgi:hypothetical protein
MTMPLLEAIPPLRPNRIGGWLRHRVVDFGTRGLLTSAGLSGLVSAIM